MTDSRKAWEEIVRTCEQIKNNYIPAYAMFAHGNAQAVLAKDAEYRDLRSRAEAAEAELASKQASANVIVEQYGVLQKENAALQGQLCRVREVLEIASVCNRDCWFIDFDNVRRIRHTALCRSITNALSSTAPCPHAAIAERAKDEEGMAEELRTQWKTVLSRTACLDIAAAASRWLVEGK